MYTEEEKKERYRVKEFKCSGRKGKYEDGNLKYMMVLACKTNEFQLACFVFNSLQVFL